MNIKKFFQLPFLTVLGFCLIIGTLSLKNARLLKTPLSQVFRGETDFSEFVHSVKEAYVSDDAAGKKYFIDLNGLFAKLSLRRVCNRVVTLSNGALSEDLGETGNVEEKAANTADLADFIGSLGIPFLYVQAPFDADSSGEMLPEGYEMKVHRDTDRFISVLKHREVPFLDLRDRFDNSPENVNRYFYRTDHHWKPQAALESAIEIAKWIYEQYPETEYSETPLKLTNWAAHSVPNLFLGSRGKRVGRFFGGMDDLEYLTPNFDTAMSCAIPSLLKLDSGTFEDAVIRPEFLEYGQDVFKVNHYSVYIGGMYPMVQHRNRSGGADLNILIIGDSYTRPVESFLSAMFTSVDVMDPRQAWHETAAEKALWDRPDAVIFLTYPGMMEEDAFYSFETPDPVGTSESEVLWMQTAEISASENRFNAKIIFDQFVDNSVYHFSTESIETGSWEDDAVSVFVMDHSDGSTYAETIFDTEFCNTRHECEWTFRTPPSGSSNLELRICPGIYSHTEGKQARYQAIRLKAFFSE